MIILVTDHDNNKAYKLLGFEKEGAEEYVNAHKEIDKKVGFSRDYEIISAKDYRKRIMALKG